MKEAITNLFTSVPPSVLFLAGFSSVLALGLWRLHSLLQSILG